MLPCSDSKLMRTWTQIDFVSMCFHQAPSSEYSPSENQNQSNYSFCIHVYLLSLWEFYVGFYQEVRPLFSTSPRKKAKKMVLGVLNVSIQFTRKPKCRNWCWAWSSIQIWNETWLIFFTSVGRQLQTASTESFFMTFGHGSPPKISGATVTEHEFSPRQVLSKTSYEWKAWQLPCRKLPQVPSGVPKLANLIDEICWPGEHHKCTFGLRGFVTLPDACICQFIRVGCHSNISEQTLSISLLTREMPFGSPPHSSKTTNKFPVGYNHDRGMWYHLCEASPQLLKHLFSLKVPV